MMLHLLALCCVTAVAGQPVQDHQELQGEWQGVEIEAQGQKAPAEEVKQFRLVIKGDEITINPDGRKSTFKLDPAKSPKQIELVPQDGPNKGKAVAAIYSLEKGQLRLCVPNYGGDPSKRPTEFKTQAGDGLGLLTLERVKLK